MVKCINQTFNINKIYSLVKTAEGNVVLDLTISDQKYRKIVTQQEKYDKPSTTFFPKTTLFSYGNLTAFLHA